MISYAISSNSEFSSVEESLSHARADDQSSSLKWCELGDQVIWWQEMDSDSPPKELLRLSDSAGRSEEGALYLVGQAGNSFLMAFPDARVVLDKGRYLIVALTAEERATAERASDACFGVLPLPVNMNVLRTSTPTPQRAVSAMPTVTDVVSETNVVEACTHLASFHTRHSLSIDFTSAIEWSSAKLQGSGFDVSINEISVGSSKSMNLVANRSGTGNARRLVMATAHLDSINVQGNSDAPAPGADDNASGAAGVLEIARILGARTFENDLCLILFGGEEQGLHGSLQYVDALSSCDRDRLDAVINMDMIGTLNVSEPTVLLEGAPISQQLINDLSHAARDYTSLTVQTSLNPFASDHVPFIKAGLPALLTIEGADSTNLNVHTANDTIDKVDGALVAEIVKMNVAVLANKLLLDEVPAYEPRAT